MKFDRIYTVKEIAGLIGCPFVGDENHPVAGLNEIHKVVEGDLVFVDHPKYYTKALKSRATTVLIDQEVECPKGKALIISKTPFDDFNKLIKHFSFCGSASPSACLISSPQKGPHPKKVLTPKRSSP